MDEVACIAPTPRPGSESTSTRRSAFSTGVNSPARSSNGRTASNAQWPGFVTGFGAPCGSTLRIIGQSGATPAADIASRYSCGNSSMVPSSAMRILPFSILISILTIYTLSIMEGQTIHTMAGHLIRRLHQISTSVFQNRMKETAIELTPVQFAALDALSRAAPVDQATLAGMIAYDRATIGTVVDRLETRGLVSRRPSQSDRRAREVELTGKGHRLLSDAWPVVAGLQQDILAGLTLEERRQFLELASRVAAAGNAQSRAPLVTKIE